MEPLLSVIIAIYNVDQFLEQCIESTLNQSLKNIEIILVDDGSTDGSPKICDAYSKRDPRVKVVHQRNEGVSSARNNGMRLSTAEYLMFVDGDDWLEPNIAEVLYKEITTSDDIDIAVSNYFTNRLGVDKIEGKGIRGWKKIYDLDACRKEIIFYTLEEEGEDDLKEMHFILSSPWAKVYRKSVIEKNHLLFPSELRRGEDEVFNLYFNQLARRIAAVNVPLYHYRFWSNSTCHKALAGSYDLSIIDRWFNEVMLFLDKFYSRDESKLIKDLFILKRVKEIEMACFSRYRAKRWSFGRAVREIKTYADKYGLSDISLANNPYMSARRKVLAGLFKAELYRVLYLYYLWEKTRRT